ncbi:hypothetical protein [Nitrospira sp. KM1]|uniref:hypothetical protein n=1 Tax=Nitrospira sp. KM1 TaxID=1936990 RepID=UPI001564B56F|nr:hypothetical protein [Nitrospira sp. KM1]
MTRQLVNVFFAGWVMWVESGSFLDFRDKQTRWSIYDAYEGRDECRAEMRELIDSIKEAAIKRGEKVSNSERYALVFEKTGGSQTARYYCLPSDTDPRIQTPAMQDNPRSASR